MGDARSGFLTMVTLSWAYSRLAMRCWFFIRWVRMFRFFHAPAVTFFSSPSPGPFPSMILLRFRPVLVGFPADPPLLLFRLPSPYFLHLFNQVDVCLQFVGTHGASLLRWLIVFLSRVPSSSNTNSCLVEPYEALMYPQGIPFHSRSDCPAKFSFLWPIRVRSVVDIFSLMFPESIPPGYNYSWSRRLSVHGISPDCVAVRWIQTK